MAYSMIHLEVAYRLLNKWDWIKNPGDFLVGAVAPDAVHFCEDYQVQMKEKSHIWDCGPRWGITEDSNKWESNVMRFWEENKGADNRDFIAGYCVHILTDIQNDIKIWRPFRQMNLEGTNVEEVYHIYGKEAFMQKREERIFVMQSRLWIMQVDCKRKSGKETKKLFCH